MRNTELAIHTASNAAELHAALEDANAGDRIELSSGDFGDFFLRDTSFASNVTIAAQDLGNPPVFESISLWNVDHLAFDGVKIDFIPDAETIETHSGFKASNSSHIAVRNSEVTGGVAINGIDPSGEPGTQTHSGINGYPIGRGLNFHNTTDIVIENNTISSFTTGVLLSTAERIEMSNNTITDTRKTPVNGSNLSDVLMDGNIFSDVTPWKYGGLGDHGDFVHFWTIPNQSRPSENFVFTNNQFLQGDGEGLMGIYLDDNRNDIGFQGVTITGNLMQTDNAQGLRLEDVQGGVIHDNTFLQSAGEDRDSRDAPGFMLADGTRDLVISGNVLAGFTGPISDNLGAHNIRADDNLFVQLQDPQGDNFIGDLYVNALTPAATLADLMALPGMAADGMGASLTQFDPGDTGFQGYLAVAKGAGLDLDVQSFAVFDGYLGTESEALDGAHFEWHFGDGTTSTGATTQHRYAEPGVYEVGVVVSQPDGQSETFQRIIHVETPYPVNNSFETLAAEQAGFEGLGSLELVDSQYGTALRLGDNSSAKFDTENGLMGNSEFSISLAFQKDAGSEDVNGRVFYYSGTAVIDVHENGITLRGRTDRGEDITLRAFDLPINDTDWHQITYTFSQSDGTATLYLDGEAVASQTGLRGSQHTTMGHQMHVGNPFGAGFEGLLDSAVFVRESLNATQVAQAYDDFVATGAPLTSLGANTQVQAAPVFVTPDASAAVADVPQVQAPEPVIQAPSTPQAPGTPQVQPTSVIEPVQETSVDLISQINEDQIDLEQIGIAARVEREEFEDFLNSADFEINFTLSAGSDGAWGEVVRLHMSFIVEVQKDGHLRLRTFSDEGELVRLVSNEPLFDGQDMHDISIRLDNGILSLGVDGSPGVAAAMQGNLRDWGAHDLVFGNPWDRQNFDGEIESFDITTLGQNNDIATEIDVLTLALEYGAGIADDGMLSHLDMPVSGNEPSAPKIPTHFDALRATEADGMTFKSDLIDQFERTNGVTSEDGDLPGL